MPTLYHSTSTNSGRTRRAKVSQTTSGGGGTGGGGGGGQTADQDFLARRSGPGVFRVFSFDTLTDRGVNQANGSGWVNKASSYTTSATGLTPVIDTTVFASGGGSLRFDFPGNNGPSCGGWYCRFSDDNQIQCAEPGYAYGSPINEFWMQFRARCNSTWRNTVTYSTGKTGLTYAAAYASDNSFTISGDKTSNFQPGYSVRTYAASDVAKPYPTYAYGEVLVSQYSSATNSTTVVLDTSNGGDPEANIPLSPLLDSAERCSQQGGGKLFDVGCGYCLSQPNSTFMSREGTYDPGSNSDCKIVIETRGQPRRFSTYGWYPGLPPVIGSNDPYFQTQGGITQIQNGDVTTCQYGGAIDSTNMTQPGCVHFEPDQWYTFKLHVKILSRSTTVQGVATDKGWEAECDLWTAPEGSPSIKIWAWNATIPGYYPISAGTLAAHEAIGKATLFPYMTSKDQTQRHGVMKIWYDELIFSTQDIPDPGVTSSGGGTGGGGGGGTTTYPAWRTNDGTGAEPTKDVFYTIPNTAMTNSNAFNVFPYNGDLISLVYFQMTYPTDPINSVSYFFNSGGHSTLRTIDWYNPVGQIDWKMDAPVWTMIDPGTTDVTLVTDQWHMSRLITAIDGAGGAGTLEIQDSGANTLVVFNLPTPCGTIQPGIGTGNTSGLLLNAITAANATKAGTAYARGGYLKDHNGVIICSVSVGLTGSGQDIELDATTFTLGQTVNVTSAKARYGYIDEYYADGRPQACHPYYHQQFVAAGKMADGKPRLIRFGEHAGYSNDFFPRSYVRGPQLHSFLLDPADWFNHTGLDGNTYKHGWELPGSHPSRPDYSSPSGAAGTVATICRDPDTNNIWCIGVNGTTGARNFRQWDASTDTWSDILLTSTTTPGLGGQGWLGGYPSWIDTKRNLFCCAWTPDSTKGGPASGKLFTITLDGNWVLNSYPFVMQQTLNYGGGLYDEFNDRYLVITRTSQTTAAKAQVWAFDPITTNVTALCQTNVTIPASDSTGNNCQRFVYLPAMKCAVFLPASHTANFVCLPLTTLA